VCMCVCVCVCVRGEAVIIMRPYAIVLQAPPPHPPLPTHTHIQSATCARRHSLTRPSPCGHLFSVHQDCRPNPRRIISSMPRLFMCNGSRLTPFLPQPPELLLCPPPIFSPASPSHPQPFSLLLKGIHHLFLFFW